MRVRIVVLAVLCLVGLVPAVEASAATPSPEPFVSWAAMVDRTYLDLIAAGPSDAERTAAVAALSSGSKSQADLVADLRGSADHTGSVDPVTRLYRAFLLRVPDKGGLEFWIKRRRTGAWTLNRIADSFASSSEFRTRYGKLSNEAFVKLIYDNVLERPYDASGLGFWTRQLDAKRKTRGAVMANFSESNEYKRKQAAEVTVSVLHIMLLGRAPNTSEFSTGVAAIEGGQAIAGYAAGLLSSTAYANRVGTPLAISTPSLPPLYAGIPFQTVLTSTGGFGDKTWTASSLPGWLTLDAATGALSGTAPAPGITNFAVTVTGGAGMTGKRTIALTVKAGMPTGCATTSCTQLSTSVDTVQIPASAISGVTRNSSNAATAVALTAAAPDVAAGNILVIAPSTNTPSGLIVKATAVTGANGADRTAAVTPSTLTEAYANGIVKSTGTTTIADQPTVHTRAARCSGNANIDIIPTADVDLKPNVTLLWGKNVAGFGDVFVGTGGVKLFQLDLFGDLTFRVKGSMTASVDCKLDVPAVTVPISVGPAGFLFFKLQPELGLKATAGIEIDTTVTVKCGVVYAYQKDQPEFRSQYCNPTYTPPKIATADAGADLTISGGVTTSLTYNEAVGISGNLTASIHAGYKPNQNPIGVLDGKVTANLSACLACAFGDNAPKLTILDRTIWEKTFAAWNAPSPAPNFPLAITTTALPRATTGEPYALKLAASGGSGPRSWSASGLPQGLALQKATGIISGVPTTPGTSAVALSVTSATGPAASRIIPLVVTTGSRPGEPLSGVTAVAAAADSTCALMDTGTVRCWGSSGEGRPTIVAGLSEVRSISIGDGLACALRADATVRCWLPSRSDGPITDPGLTNVTSISIGSLNSCAVLADATVRCWGNNTMGELGDGTLIPRSGPVSPLGLSGVAEIDVWRAGTASQPFSCATLLTGSIKCWGGIGPASRYWQTTGQVVDTTEPKLLPSVTDATSAAAGDDRACALRSNQSVVCWGEPFPLIGLTQSGIGPQTLPGVTGATAIELGVGGGCALLSDGRVRCWGSNLAGELGIGSTSPRSVPVDVVTLADVDGIAHGDNHACALLGDGTVRCWGLNDHQQLGDGTTTNRSSPVTVVT